MRRGNEMEMKSRVVQWCIDACTLNMIAILGLRHIQVKGEIVRILTRIRHEGSWKLHRSRTGRCAQSVHRLVN